MLSSYRRRKSQLNKQDKQGKHVILGTWFVDEEEARTISGQSNSQQRRRSLVVPWSAREVIAKLSINQLQVAPGVIFARHRFHHAYCENVNYLPVLHNPDIVPSSLPEPRRRRYRREQSLALSINQIVQTVLSHPHHGQPRQ